MTTDPPPKNLFEHEDAHGRRLVEEALKKADGAVVRAAEFLGVSRVSLWRRMRRYGLKASAFRKKRAGAPT